MLIKVNAQNRKQFLEAIVRIKENNPKFKSIKFSSLSNLEDIKLLAKALMQNKRIHSIDLSDNPLCLSSIKEIATIISNRDNLSEFNLCNTKICTKGSKYILDATKKNDNLIDLAMSSNLIYIRDSTHLVSPDRLSHMHGYN